MSEQEQIQAERETLLILLREKKSSGWLFTLDIEVVPNEAGYYAMDDGLSGCGGGVTYHMRDSIKNMHRYTSAKRPIYSWKPDDDGRAVEYLQGMYT